jgi:hypothetical protein
MITMVPREEVQNVWATVAPMLKKALDRAPGRYAPEDIFIALLKGHQTLWVYADGEIKAAWTTRVYDVPLGRVMAFEWIGGEEVNEWVEEAISIGERYAKDMGCTRIEGHGREGWFRFLQRQGWQRLASSFEKELTDG